MSVVEFSNYVNTAIQAGSAIEGTAVRVLADNGAQIGQAVATEVAAGGGAGATIYTLVQGGAGGANIATGVSLLFLELPTAAAGVAACLGIAAGFGLYELAPDFWTSVSNALVDAGQTVGGKIVTYWDGENTYYTQETIEIIKNALVDINAFQQGGMESDLTIYYPQPIICGDKLYAIYENDVRVVVENTDGWSSFKVTGLYDPTDPLWWVHFIASGDPNSGLSSSYTYNGKTVYWEYSYSKDGRINVAPRLEPYSQYASQNPRGLLNVDGNALAWTMIYGEDITNPFPLQDGAIFPTNQPFYQTYTEWTLHEFPQTLPDPDELPKIYPVKYPSTNPDPYPLQEPAQNPDPEPVPEIYPQIIPNFDLPDPLTDPEPQPEPQPDPDPEPAPDPITDPATETPTQPDPLDPNPDPTPSAPIVVPSLPATVASNKLFTVYNPSTAQLDALGGYLWDGSIIAAIRDIWQEPLDGLISLIQVFVTPTTSGNHNIILGFLDSGVSSAVVSNQFVTVDCGSVTIDEDKQNATDYAPYTSIHLYLPFIGFVELDTNEVMNSTISVKYKVDVYTGTCLASVSVDRTADMPNDPILYTYSGNCSQQIPLTSGNATGMLSALIGGITAGLSVASGGGLGIMAGAQILGNSLTHDMFHVNHSGNLSANAGIMGQKKPYVIIGRRHGYDANNYSHFYGFPVNKTVVLGNHTGYAQVKKCLLQTKATKPEYDEIMSLLGNGVIL